MPRNEIAILGNSLLTLAGKGAPRRTFPSSVERSRALVTGPTVAKTCAAMTKKAFFALAVAAAGCSSAPDISENGSPIEQTRHEGATSQQLRAFSALEASTGQRWTWIQHDRYASPAHLSTARTGKPVLVSGVSVEKATHEFLAKYKDLFGMREPAVELASKRVRTDALGMTHARFQQVVHGVPVAGAELTAHYDAAGRLTSIDANYVPGLENVDLEPALDAQTGLAQVKADVLARMPDVAEAQLETEGGKLVVFPGAAEARLAYQYTVRAIAGEHPAIWVTTLDAKTGEILDRYDNLQTIEATGTATLGDTKKFQVAQSGGGYVMTDTSRGVTIRTYTAAKAQQTPGTSITSTSLTQWDTGVTGAGAAVDAHTYAGVVYDYYKKTHARNGINGNGATMESTAHFGTAYDNAFWDGRGMTYGDGGQLFKPLAAGLDVVAHEFTHGVTEIESGLVYQNQSGALNEAVSDIFAAFIEHSYKADETKNWIMGEAIMKAGVMRDFKNPAAGQQPAHMNNYRNTQQDNGGVHINSGIINNAAFLMTSGGTNPVSKVEVKFGIGWEKSEKLWYRANTQYFQSNTNFAQAAAGVLQAAKDIALTANEQAIVDCAWKAVGIGNGACSPITDPNAKPQSQTPGTGDDGTGTGSGETPGSGDTSTGAEDGTSDGEEPGSGTQAPSRRRGLSNSSYDSSGCSVGTQGGVDLGPLAGLLVALSGLVAKRRRRA